MITDEAEIKIVAGHGGPGKASFFKKGIGPDGGNGGRGGDIYFTATSDSLMLGRYWSQKSFAAKPGEPGGNNSKSGHDAPELVLEVPVGTEITDLDTGETWTISSLTDKVLVAKGGIGGLGNEARKSPMLTTPLYAQHGLPGKERRLKLNLKLIANFGLIGLPNAGKSSLLNAVTNANAKIGDYAFTTLEPNLGVLKTFDGRNIVITDVPGLIEGASAGKGLGMRFLKHIEKVPVLLHCISATSATPLADYKTIREELKTYGKDLLKKKEIILLTKIDEVTPDVQAEKIALLKKTHKRIIPVSVLKDDTIANLKKLISKSVS